MYGLLDASHYWYLKLREELINLGTTPSQLDHGIFYYFEGNSLSGIAVIWVDDILYAGNDKFLEIIAQIKNIFHIGTENESPFTYVGIHLVQDESYSITIDQQAYSESLNAIPLVREQVNDPHRVLNKKEESQLRGAIGQLNWLANITRPEISYQVSKISSEIPKATISTLKEVNKIIKFIKTTPSHILFPSLHVQSIRVRVYADASFNNDVNGSSQGGHIVLLSDKNKLSCPISWRSNKVRRVARSTLAAETLAMADGSETALFILKLGSESGHISVPQEIISLTDNRSLYEAVNTTSQISDRRLRVEISMLRQMQEKNEIKICWTRTQNQLADSLTKKGAPFLQLLTTLKEGKLPHLC